MALYNKIKSTALCIILVMLLPLTACGNGVETTNATKKSGVGETATEAADETTEPLVEFVEPATENFEYNYDESLEGIIITRYSGQAEKSVFLLKLTVRLLKKYHFLSIKE